MNGYVVQWEMGREMQDKNLHVVGRAALLRRPIVQGRAAALPYQEGVDFCHAPWVGRNSRHRNMPADAESKDPQFSRPPTAIQPGPIAVIISHYK